MNEVQLITDKEKEVAVKMDNAIREMALSKFEGFEKSFAQAKVIQIIEEALTEEFMKPIVLLQNKKIGFKTDSKTGYTLETIRGCVIEAKFHGLEVTGNHFNIIAGNMYITKEGYSHKLLNTGVKNHIIYDIPVFNGNKATVECTMQWWPNGEKGEMKTAKRTFIAKVNTGMTDDGIIGKVERKAKKWLYEEITGDIISDGEVVDTVATVVETKQNPDQTQSQPPMNATTSAAPTPAQEKKGEEIHYEEVKAEAVAPTPIPVQEAPAPTQTEKPAASAALQERANKYLSSAKDLTDLEKRWAQTTGLENKYDDKVYLEMKEKLK